MTPETEPAAADVITTGPKLDTPLAVAGACREAAASMDQQAAAAQSNAPHAGHPQPAFLYAHTADVLRAAADLLAPAPPGATLVPPPAPPAPPADGNWPAGGEAPAPAEKPARAAGKR